MASLIPAAIGAVSGGIKIIKGINQDGLANKVVVPDATYNTSPYARAMLATATQMKNAKMPGAQNAEAGILGNQANTVGAIDRNSNSGAQALSMVSAAQGNTDNALNNLGTLEGKYAMETTNNLNNAQQTMINEGDKVYQDKVRKQQAAIQEKNNLRAASTANWGGGMNDVFNGAMASFGPKLDDGKKDK